MTYWIFANQADADAAQAQAFAALPPDERMGQDVSPPITSKWDDVVATTDGRFAFHACPLIVQPATATAMDDADMAALLPPEP